MRWFSGLLVLLLALLFTPAVAQATHAGPQITVQVTNAGFSDVTVFQVCGERATRVVRVTAQTSEHRVVGDCPAMNGTMTLLVRENGGEGRSVLLENISANDGESIQVTVEATIQQTWYRVRGRSW